MRTWLNVFGGLMILWPLGLCFWGASEAGERLLEGLKAAAVIGFAWLVFSGYTTAAIWLVLQ